jgi:hypothetical protein
MESKLICVPLPTNTGKEDWQCYTCERNGCDNCPIRFQCFTESDKLEMWISYPNWCKVKDKLKWYGQHP